MSKKFKVSGSRFLESSLRFPAVSYGWQSVCRESKEWRRANRNRSAAELGAFSLVFSMDEQRKNNKDQIKNPYSRFIV